MKHRYRNPWHDPAKAWMGPEFFETDSAPFEYRGFQIFKRIVNSWELVKDGVCLTQRCGNAGPRFIGAQHVVDSLFGDARDWDNPHNSDRIREVAKRMNVDLPVAMENA
jgi:hypothetical protein